MTPKTAVRGRTAGGLGSSVPLPCMILKDKTKGSSLWARLDFSYKTNRAIAGEALIISLLLCGLLSFAGYSSCGRRSVEETVTTDLARQMSGPQNAQPIVVQHPPLPERDPDIETAGDRIAEAIMRLRRHQSSPALRALARATSALMRANRSAERNDRERELLFTAIHQVQTAENLIARGAIDQAIKQLNEANRNLDRVNLHQP